MKKTSKPPTIMGFKEFSLLHPNLVISKKTSYLKKIYLENLVKMKELISSAIGKEHLALLYFRYDESSELKRDGNYHVECILTDIDNNEISFEHYKSYAYTPNRETYLNQGTGKIRKRCFTTEHRYLSKVIIFWDRTRPALLIDDGYDGSEK